MNEYSKNKHFFFENYLIRRGDTMVKPDFLKSTPRILWELVSSFLKKIQVKIFLTKIIEAPLLERESGN